MSFSVSMPGYVPNYAKEPDWQQVECRSMLETVSPSSVFRRELPEKWKSVDVQAELRSRQAGGADEASG
jgi:hypothetical protein